ncbi:electron transport complex subunit RsxB [Aliikangiella sp. IMCC44653]
MQELVIALTTLVIFAASCGALLGYASVKFKVEGDPLVDQINQILPQTQCGQCGYPGCKPYAQAIASESEKINRCPPGGEAGIKALADLLEVEVIALDEACGEEEAPRVAVIREDECIGCTKCIQACPVDAIVGAAKQMHTVIESECTGCDLCVEPCPVDCIDMPFKVDTLENWQWPKPNQNLTQSIPVKLIS